MISNIHTATSVPRSKIWCLWLKCEYWARRNIRYPSLMCSLGRKMRRAMLYLEHQIDTPVPSAFLHLWGVMCVRSPDIRFIQLIAINIVEKHSSQSKNFDVLKLWYAIESMQFFVSRFRLIHICLRYIWERVEALHVKSKWPTECLLLSARYRYHPNEL